LAPVRGFLKRSGWAASVGVLACLGASEAGAAERVASDRQAEVRFALDGRALTLTVVDRLRFDQHPKTVETLSGSRVKVICGTTFYKPTPHNYVLRRVRWPAGATSMTVQFRRDISARAKWCLVEPARSGGDIASVSFHAAEPGRRLTTGRLPDGRPWRLAAWRGEMLEPCLSLRTKGEIGGICFPDLAETDAGVEAYFTYQRCSGPTFVLGASARAAVRVVVKTKAGETVDAQLRSRPRGSRVRAQYFFAILDGVALVASVTSYDADGRMLARDRGINGSGVGCGP
jgi:hypothetical protein